MKAHQQIWRSRRRGGFSILEVLLAMVLSTALLAGLFSALSLFMRSFDSGRTNVEQAQLARAMLRQISGDLRAAVIDSSNTGSSTGPANPLALPSDFQSPVDEAPASPDTLSPERIQVLSPVITESVPREAATRLVGTSDRLDLCVRSTGAAAALAALIATSEPTTDTYPDGTTATGPSNPGRVLQVSYFCQDPTDPDRLPLDPTGQVARAESARTDEELPGVGLVRREAPWSESAREDSFADAHALAPVDSMTTSTGEDSPALPENMASVPTSPRERQVPTSLDLAPIVETRTPEIVAVAFRYFDGSAWYSSWDSASDGGLPVAVDVSFWFAEPADEVRRPRVAAERGDPADATTADATGPSESPRSARSLASDGSSVLAEAAYGESEESLPDYRLIVHLALARPRNEESPLPLSSPEELQTPSSDEPATYTPPPPPMPTTAAPTRRSSRPSFLRPPTSGGRP